MTTLTPIDSQRAVRAWLEAIAGSRAPAESIKAMLGRISKTVGLPPSRVKKLWYAEVEAIGWHEAETIRRRAEERKRIKDHWADIAADQKLAEVIARLERLERDGKVQVERRSLLAGPSDCDGQATLDLGGTPEFLDQRKQVT